MEASELMVSLAGLLAITAIFALITGVLRYWMINRTMREALKSQPEQMALVSDKLGMRADFNFDLWGLIGIATGAALAVAGVIGEAAQQTLLLQSALLPGFIGVALIGQRWLPRRAEKISPPDEA